MGNNFRYKMLITTLSYFQPFPRYNGFTVYAGKNTKEY
jgi:hypothetical protein